MPALGDGQIRHQAKLMPALGDGGNGGIKGHFSGLAS